MPLVTIVQRRLTHYRLPLFQVMRTELRSSGIELRLLHGQGTKKEQMKGDAGHLPWAEQLPTRYLLDGRLCWQPFLRRAAGSDLVIVTQENKLVNNLLAIANPWRRPALAFWGHGRNMQAQQPDGALERFKRWTTNRVDWWFAYTELSADFVRTDGFPAARITVLDNSIDTGELRAAVELARSQPRATLRAGFGLGTGPVGLFLGSLYGDKRLPFLLEAARALHLQRPDFQLVIAGDGPERGWLERAAAGLPFVTYVGSVRGERKAQLLASADLMLNPGLVGLGILDAFVAGLPMFTTDCRLHSPEIAYLDNGRNGRMTPDSLTDYVQAILALLADPAAMARLQGGAREAGLHYSIEHMTERFCTGIQACLAAVRPPSAR